MLASWAEKSLWMPRRRWPPSHDVQIKKSAGLGEIICGKSVDLRGPGLACQVKEIKSFEEVVKCQALCYLGRGNPTVLKDVEPC